MPKGKRYTPAQKEQMKKKALAMRAKGSSQKAIADELGVAVMTLSKLLGGAPAKGRKKAVADLEMNSPAVKLALMNKRLESIDGEISALEQEKADLAKEMKDLYQEMGKDLFGKK